MFYHILPAIKILNFSGNRKGGEKPLKFRDKTVIVNKIPFIKHLCFFLFM